MTHQLRTSAKNALERFQNLPSDQSGDSADNESSDDYYVEEYIEQDRSDEEEYDAKPSLSIVPSSRPSWNWTFKREPFYRDDSPTAAPKCQPGPTAFARDRVTSGSPLSAFRLFIDETLLRNIRKCTEEEGMQHIEEFSISIEDLEKFIGLVIARGMSGGRNFPVTDFWSTLGSDLYRQTMSRDRFLKLMRYLRFDLKSDRKERLRDDKFCMASLIWEQFIDNCKHAYCPSQNLGIGDQLLPCKARCKFIQFVANKPEKFGIKFWMLVDVKNKYLCNGFPYLGKECTSAASESLQTRVVLKLVKPYENQGYNVICSDYYTSLDLAAKLKAKKFTLVGMIKTRRSDVPNCLNEKINLFSSKTCYEESCGAQCTLYQLKPQTSMCVLSTLHELETIPETDNPHRKPESLLFYDKNKGAVDILDSMSRVYTVRAGSRHWPMHVFYNILDLAIINSWILYKEITNSRMSRRSFIQSLILELTGFTKNAHEVKPEIKSEPVDDEISYGERKRRCCQIRARCQKNRTRETCYRCQKRMCGKCRFASICYKCGCK